MEECNINYSGVSFDDSDSDSIGSVISNTQLDEDRYNSQLDDYHSEIIYSISNEKERWYIHIIQRLISCIIFNR